MYEDVLPLTPSQAPGVRGQLYTRPVRSCLSRKGSVKFSPPSKVPQGAPTMSLWEGRGQVNFEGFIQVGLFSRGYGKYASTCTGV